VSHAGEFGSSRTGERNTSLVIGFGGDVERSDCLACCFVVVNRPADVFDPNRFDGDRFGVVIAAARTFPHRHYDPLRGISVRVDDCVVSHLFSRILAGQLVATGVTFDDFVPFGILVAIRLIAIAGHFDSLFGGRVRFLCVSTWVAGGRFGVGRSSDSFRHVLTGRPGGAARRAMRSVIAIAAAW